MAYITLQHLRKAVESLILRITDKFDFLNNKIDNLDLFSGNYNDLTNKPTLITQSDLNNKVDEHVSSTNSEYFSTHILNEGDYINLYATEDGRRRGYISVSGDSVNISGPNVYISDVATPTSGSMVANKDYVDSMITSTHKSYFATCSGVYNSSSNQHSLTFLDNFVPGNVNPGDILYIKYTVDLYPSTNNTSLYKNSTLIGFITTSTTSTTADSGLAAMPMRAGNTYSFVCTSTGQAGASYLIDWSPIDIQLNKEDVIHLGTVSTTSSSYNPGNARVIDVPTLPAGLPRQNTIILLKFLTDYNSSGYNRLCFYINRQITNTETPYIVTGLPSYIKANDIIAIYYTGNTTTVSSQGNTQYPAWGIWKDFSNETFIATYNSTTYNEVYQAVFGNKIVICKYGVSGTNIYAPLASYSSSEFRFCCPHSPSGSKYILGLTSSGWTIISSGPYNAVTSTANVESGDYLLFGDANSLNRISRDTSLAFGTDTTKYLANNGTWQDIPITTSSLMNDSNFITSTDLSTAISNLGTVFNYKGTKATQSELPSSGNTTGDVWLVSGDNTEHIWNGTAWEEFGPTIDLSGYALSSDIPTNVSDLTNDSGYLTANDLPDNTFIAQYNVTTGAVVKQHYDNGENIVVSWTPDMEELQGTNTTVYFPLSLYTQTEQDNQTGYLFYFGGQGFNYNIRLLVAGNEYLWETVDNDIFMIKEVDYVTAGKKQNTTLGEQSTAEGNNVTSSGLASHAEGIRTVASANFTHAEGYETTASALEAHAEGSNTVASAAAAHAEGYLSVASGRDSHAEGYESYAIGEAAHSEGELTTAFGDESHAEGRKTFAQGIDSHSEGFGTFALGNYSHAEGKGNTPIFIKITGEANATTYTSDIDMTDYVNSQIILLITYGSGINSATISSVNGTSFTVNKTLSSSNALDSANAAVSTSGYSLGNYATASGAHVEGTLTKALHNSTHAEGYSSSASGQYGAHAEGYGTTASGTYGSHAEGRSSKATATGAHAEGYNTTASGNYSHAEGYNTVASGLYSHAEGNKTQSTSDYTHAEGAAAVASGSYSHGEGIATAATNNASHAEGTLTIASGIASHAEGQSDSADGGGSHAEGGNGSIKIYLSGAYNATTFTVESCDITSVFPTIYYDEDFIMGAHVNCGSIDNNFYRTIVNYTLDTSGATPKISTIEINNPFSTTKNLATNDTSNYDNNEFVLILSNAKGRFSHSEGYRTIAKGQAAHAEGEGTRALSPNSHAEGIETYVGDNEADGGHAEGIQTVVTGGFGAHAEGCSTQASGESSHAEGEGSVASGYTAHAEGNHTIAQREAQHTFGEYNIADVTGTTSTRGSYVEIVGNGTADNARSNARTLDWNGNEVLAGKLTVGAGPTNNMDVATKQYVDGVVSGGISTETDPTVPAWAKQSTKPSYTAAEVGAIADTAPAASITSTDITNWNSIVSDDHKWNDVSLSHSAGVVVGGYVPHVTSQQSTTAMLVQTTYNPTNLVIPLYDDSACLHSTTPNANSNNNIVATTEFVQTAISGITYPVTSVNTKTGAVTLTASDVGAIADTAPAASITSTDISNWDSKVDSSSLSNYVAKSGDTMTGSLIIQDNSTSDVGLIFKSNSNDSVKIKITGSNGGTTIVGFDKNIVLDKIANPTDRTHAANKQYVDNKFNNITFPVTSVNEQTGNVLIDKIKTSAPADNTTYNLMGTASTNVNTQVVDVYNPTLLTFSKYDNNFARLTVGSTSTPGQIRLYSSTSSATGYIDLKSGSTSTNTRTITFPDANGTVALTSDIPNVSSWALAANKPSYTFSELTTTPTTLGGYGITDAYTKTEVDGLVSGVLHYKGVKATVSALPSSGNTTGDVWHITADGSEYAWDGSDWQELGTATDLSRYVPTSRTVNGKALSTDITLSASDVSALPSNTAYVSTFNGQSGAITYTAPVTSVNGQTGAVTLTIPSAITNNYSNDNDGDILINGTNTHTANSTITSTKTSGALTFSTTNGLQIGKAHSEEGSKGSINLSNSASSNQNYTTITPSATAAVTITLPNTTGTLALTSDIPSVPSWALQSTKPTYTASEVGAVPSDVDTAGGSQYGQIYNSAVSGISLVHANAAGSSKIQLVGRELTLTSTKSQGNSSIVLKTNSTNVITLSEGQATIIGVVTPTTNDMAANKGYVDSAISALTIPTRYNSSTNTTGYLTMADLPIYNGTVI